MVITAVVRQEVHRVVRHDVLGMLGWNSVRTGEVNAHVDRL